MSILIKILEKTKSKLILNLILLIIKIKLFNCSNDFITDKYKYFKITNGNYYYIHVLCDGNKDVSKNFREYSYNFRNVEKRIYKNLINIQINCDGIFVFVENKNYFKM